MNLKISDNPNADKDKKRLIAVFELDNGKQANIKFGFHKSQGTFYDTGDKKKKAAYIARHKVRENFNDIMTAGALSRFILWHDTNLNNIKKLLKSRFNIKKIDINFNKYKTT